MLRYLVLLVLVVAMLAPSVRGVYAETSIIDDGPPKGVVGADGMSCTGTVSQDGHTVIRTTYTGADGDEMANNPGRERSWQYANCKWQLEQNMSGWFLYRHGLVLDVSRIKVTYKLL